MHNRGYHVFPSKFFCLTVPKILLGNTLVYQEISVIQKLYASERGEYQVGPSRAFCHTVPENFVGEHFGVSESFGYRKSLCIRERERERGGGAGNTFSVKNFCHTVPKNSVGEHFGVSENFVYRKFLCIRSGYH